MSPSVKPWFLLGALCGGLVLVAEIWVTLDRRPPVWDHAIHLEGAIRCQRILAERGIDGIREILEASSFYPPVVRCAAGALFGLAGVSPQAGQAAILAFLALGLASLFALGRRLFDAGTGLLAALIFGTAPFVVYSTTNFQFDLPLAAAVAFALLCLVRTEEFADRRWSVATGLAFAFGMLVKPPFAVYFLPPLLLVAWRALRAPDRGARLGNLALALLLGGALSLPWYGPRLFGLPMQILNRSFALAAEQGHAAPLTAASLLFYPQALLPALGLLAGPLFAWGLLALARHRSVRGLLWIASLVPFGVFLLIRNKDLRYVLPLFPVAALIAASGLLAPAPVWRRRLTVAVAGVSVLQVGAAAFDTPPVPRWTPFNFPIVFAATPSPVEWPHREILAAIMRASGGAPATVSVVPNDSYFSVSNFRYYAVKENLPLKMMRAWDPYPLGVHFAILKTGDQGPAFSIAKAKRIMARLEAGDPAFERMFPVIWQAPLPDGSLGVVRQRRLPPVTGASAETLARRLKEAVPRFLAPYARDLEGLEVDLIYAPGALLKGEVRRVQVTARGARIAEFARRGAQIRVRELRLALEDVLINPHRLAGSGEIEPLEMKRLRVDHLVVTEADLQAFLSGLRRFRGLRVRFEAGTVAVTLAQPGPDVAGRLRLLSGRGAAPFALQPEQLSLGGVPLPGILVTWVFRNFDPAPRLARLPVRVEIGEIRVEPGRLVVSRSGPA